MNKMNMIKINNENLIIDELPVEMQSLISILEHATTESTTLRKNLAVTEAGIRQLQREIASMYKSLTNAPPIDTPAP